VKIRDYERDLKRATEEREELEYKRRNGEEKRDELEGTAEHGHQELIKFGQR